MRRISTTAVPTSSINSDPVAICAASAQRAMGSTVGRSASASAVRIRQSVSLFNHRWKSSCLIVATSISSLLPQTLSVSTKSRPTVNSLAWSTICSSSRHRNDPPVPDSGGGLKPHRPKRTTVESCPVFTRFCSQTLQRLRSLCRNSHSRRPSVVRWWKWNRAIWPSKRIGSAKIRWKSPKLWSFCSTDMASTIEMKTELVLWLILTFKEAPWGCVFP